MIDPAALNPGDYVHIDLPQTSHPHLDPLRDLAGHTGRFVGRSQSTIGGAVIDVRGKVLDVTCDLLMAGHGPIGSKDHLIQVGEDQLPRRNSAPHWDVAEQRIHAAMSEVEKLGAHPHLTAAVSDLESAANYVADFLEGRNNGDPINTINIDTGPEMQAMADALGLGDQWGAIATDLDAREVLARMLSAIGSLLRLRAVAHQLNAVWSKGGIYGELPTRLMELESAVPDHVPSDAGATDA